MMEHLESCRAQSVSILQIIETYSTFTLFEGKRCISNWKIPETLIRPLWNPSISENQFYCTADEHGSVYVYKQTSIPTNRSFFQYTMPKNTIVYVYTNTGQKRGFLKLFHIFFQSIQVLNNRIYILYSNHICVENINIHDYDENKIEETPDTLINERQDGIELTFGDYQLRFSKISDLFKHYEFTESANEKNITLKREFFFDSPSSASKFIVFKNENFVILTHRTLIFIDRSGIITSKIPLKLCTYEDKYCPAIDNPLYNDITSTDDHTIVVSYTNYNSTIVGSGCLLYNSCGDYLGKYWDNTNVPVVMFRGLSCMVSNITITPHSEIVVSFSYGPGSAAIFVIYTLDHKYLRTIVVPIDAVCLARPLILCNGKLLLSTTKGFQLWE